MALINIGEGNKEDTFYRYKMPKLITKIEGRGNGIKTNIVNMVDVAKALARPPAYTTKFFGCVLGAQSKYEEKTATSTVNGAHDTAKLVQLLETFIKKYVQCYGCGNPETEIIITKTQKIQMKCAACGFMSDVDMRDKLTTFIINHPPEQEKGKGAKLRRAEKERLKAGEAADEEAKKSKSSSKKSSKKGSEEDKKKSSKKAKEDENGEKEISPDTSLQGEDERAEEEDDVEWQTDTSAAAAQQRIKEQLSAATSEMVMIDIAEDTVTEPVKVAEIVEDPEEDEDGAKDLSAHDEMVKDLRDYISTHNMAELANYMKSKGDLTQESANALFEALFQGVGKGLSKEVGKKKILLKQVLPDEESQLLLLGALELYCGKTNPDALREVALTLKVLYDDDVVEEEQILQWYECKGSGADPAGANAVRKQAKPFVDWLSEAEPESDED